jgi:hypothetical protein
MIIDSRKRCVDCEPKKGLWLAIKGAVYERYSKNKLINQEYFCQPHWIARGRPKPEKVVY